MSEASRADIDNTRGHKFLHGCHSKPRTIGDLKAGECFVIFPRDYEDIGFERSLELLVKINPWVPYGLGESHRRTAFEYERPQGFVRLGLDFPVIVVHGVTVDQEKFKMAERQKLIELKAPGGKAEPSPTFTETLERRIERLEAWVEKLTEERQSQEKVSHNQPGNRNFSGYPT